MRKIVLITGASSGIGMAIGARLTMQGFHVIGTRRNSKSEDDAAFETVPLDVRDQASVNECIERVVAKVGRIDVLINNAGHALLASAEQTRPTQLQDQFDIHMFGVARMVSAVLPHMRDQGRGLIVNISSLVGFAAIPYLAAYSASKFALEGYSEALYHELRPLGIHVSLVQPGMVKTRFFAKADEVSNDIRVYTPWFRQAKREIVARSQKGVAADVVAQKVARLCQQKNPPLITRVGSDAKLVGRLKRLLPNAVFNKIWQREFGLNRVKPLTTGKQGVFDG